VGSKSDTLRVTTVDRATIWPRRNDFGNDPVTVSYQHSLAAGGVPHIFAELVLERLEPDRPYWKKVAARGYFANRWNRRRARGATTGSIAALKSTSFDDNFNAEEV
jgi:hypothetical protein